MTAAQLSHDQAHRLCEQIARQLRYLNRLCERMQRTAWQIDDPLYRCAKDARNAMQALYVEAMTGTGDAGPPKR